MKKQATTKKKKAFTTLLLEWATTHERPMPWKGEKKPYLIWLSEIILQQTRVEQGLNYFLKFKRQYPTIKELADAPEDEVMKTWEGLGYYSRARNLHATAKYIAYELDSVFPTTYDTILNLKGVGPYTAAAIASFAYDLPHAVLDGNVFRVLARHFGIETPIDSTKGRKEFKILADELIDHKKAAAYNQAIMDFGAACCTPKKPNCTTCVLQKNCTALQTQKVANLPFKEKKLKKRTRYFSYLVINKKNTVWINKRLQKDIWQNLYEFPLIETEKDIDRTELFETDIWKQLMTSNNATIKKKSKPFKQTLSHQYIIATFWEISIKGDFDVNNDSYMKTERKNLVKFAFPKIIDWYLQDNSLYLELL